MDRIRPLPISSSVPIGGSLSSVPKRTQGNSSSWVWKYGLLRRKRQIAVWWWIQWRWEKWQRRVKEVVGHEGGGRGEATGE